MEILEFIHYYRIFFAVVFLFCFVCFFQFWFIPYYHNTLREKIRKAIVSCYLDDSGKKICINQNTETHDFMKFLELVETTFMVYSGGKIE
jgi:hypothetical protein